MRKTSQQPTTSAQPRPLTTDELARIYGGRDAASGLPTGKRQHPPV
jgi:hypothetical protein